MGETSKVPKSSLHICRLCLGDEQLEDIFEQEDLHEWISKFLSIVVRIDDKVSKSICFCCRTQLREFRSFQQHCLAVQNVLQAEAAASLHQHGSISDNDVPEMAIRIKQEEVSETFDMDNPMPNTSKGNGREMNFVCHVCDKVYYRPIRLRKHMELHHPEVLKEKSTEMSSEIAPFQQDNLVNEPGTSFESTCVEFPNSMANMIKQEPITEDPQFDQEWQEGFGTLGTALNEFVPRSLVESIKVEERVIEDENVNQEFVSQTSPILKEENDQEEDPSAGSDEWTISTSSRDVNNERPSCKVCDKTFRDRRQWYAHQYSVHGPKHHICPICGKGFVTKSRLRIHERFHAPKNLSKISRRRCIISPPKLDNAFESNEPTEPIQPVIVENNVDDEPKEPTTFIITEPNEEASNIDISVGKLPEAEKAAKDDDRPFLCDICKKKYATTKSLRDHKRLVHGPKNHVCNVCNKGFTIREWLERHMLVHTEKNQSIFPLLVESEEVFADPVHGPRCHLCNICQETFVQVRQLETHKAIKHKNYAKYAAAPLKPELVTITNGNEQCLMFKCSNCSKMLPTRKQLFDHRKRAHRPKEYACPICGKPAVTLQEMYLHSRTHSKNVPKNKNLRGPDGLYDCGICPKAFKSKNAMFAHRKLHDKEPTSDSNAESNP